MYCYSIPHPETLKATLCCFVQDVMDMAAFDNKVEIQHHTQFFSKGHKKLKKNSLF